MKFHSAVIALLSCISPANAWMNPSRNTNVRDQLPRLHYVEQQVLIDQQDPTKAIPQSIKAAAGALTSAMAPLFPAHASGKFAEVPQGDAMPSLDLTSIQGVFSDAINDLNQRVFDMNMEFNEKIAASILTALNENGVATNQETYDMVQQAYVNLSGVLQKLEGLSTEEKVAAAIATVVASYPLSYEYYKYEQNVLERTAAEKKAALAKKKKAKGAAKKKAKASSKKKGKKAADDTVKAKKSGVKGSKTPKKSVESDLPVGETVVTVESAPAEVMVTTSAPPEVGNTSGADAYSLAYAAMMKQAEQSKEQPASETSPVASKGAASPVVSKKPVAPTISATGSYLDTL